MKTLSIIMLVSSLSIMQACDNGTDNKDSVDSAQSMNEDKDTTGMSNNETTTMPVNENVADFAVKAANGGMMEVELSKAAKTKATSQEVKDFAAMMVKDHTKVNDELKKWAKNKNITLPAMMGDDMKTKMDDAMKMTGADFDKDYIDMMVKAHKDDVDLFERQANNGEDATVKSWASKTLPTLRAHLTKIQAIDEKM